MTSDFTGTVRVKAGHPGTLQYSGGGQGTAVILVHPVGLDRSWWEAYQSRLREQYTAITVDLRGHGHSSGVPDGFSLADFAEDVAQIINQVSAGPVHLVGVSMGGMVAQHLAIDHPELVASLVLFSTTGFFPPESRPSVAERGTAAITAGMSAVVDETLLRWFGADGHEAARLRCERNLLRMSPTDWMRSWKAIAAQSTLKELRDVRVPALIVTGDADASTGPTTAAQLYDALPDARLHIVDRACHLGAFTDIERFFEPLRRHLADVAGGR